MDYNKLATWLGPDLAEVRSHMLHALEPSIAEGLFASILSETVQGTGKMLRPILMLLIADDYDRRYRDELLATAAAYELGHTASLVLDDVIDGAPTRRGRPSVQHACGKPVALCTSDYLLMTAQGYLLELGYVRSASEMAKLVRIMCAGEVVQFEHVHDLAASTESYLRAIQKKTASLFESCCRLAAQITCKSESYVAAMAAFGDALGIMFQIRDDLSDWTSDEAQSGKPVNEDFAGGVYTLPAIYAFADEALGERLRELASKPHPSEDDLAEARRLVTEAGGIAYAQRYLHELSERALRMLEALPDGTCRTALEAIVRMVAQEG